jgi:uncharacterized damage-inducible protein DinB
MLGGRAAAKIGSVRQPRKQASVQIDDVRTLFAYDKWANQRLLSAVRLLPGSEFTRELAASFGSVKGTFVHILDGEWHWLQLWQGKPRSKRPAPEDFADAAAVADAFPELEQGQQEFVNTLTDSLLQVRWQIKDGEYALASLIQHVVNHSTYHRGQISTLLRQLGHTPPATDYRPFLDATRPGATASGAA